MPRDDLNTEYFRMGDFPVNSRPKKILEFLETMTHEEWETFIVGACIWAHPKEEYTGPAEVMSVNPDGRLRVFVPTYLDRLRNGVRVRSFEVYHIVWDMRYYSTLVIRRGPNPVWQPYLTEADYAEWVVKFRSDLKKTAFTVARMLRHGSFPDGRTHAEIRAARFSADHPRTAFRNVVGEGLAGLIGRKVTQYLV